MAYRFKRRESVRDGVRRIADEQLEAAAAVMRRAAEGEEDRTRAIHETRRSFKRLRALARLARGGLGRKRCTAETAFFREAARQLSGGRDAHAALILLETLDREEPLPEALYETTQRSLRARLDVDLARLDSDSVFGEMAGTLEEARRRAGDWPWLLNGWDALRGGLLLTYRRSRNAMREVCETPSTELLHYWRRWVKHLFFEAQMLQKCDPESMTLLGGRLGSLASVLGADHDLAALSGHIAGLSAEGALDPEAFTEFERRISVRRGWLLEEAMELGKEIHRQPPGKFVDRVHESWRAWRD